MNKFLGALVELKVDAKTCQRPVKINVTVNFAGYTFKKIFHGSENYPLTGSRFEGYGIELDVNANPYNNKDLHLEVSF